MVDRLQKDLIFTSKSDKATLIASRVVRLYMGDVETHQYFELLRGGASDIDYVRLKGSGRVQNTERKYGHDS